MLSKNKTAIEKAWLETVVDFAESSMWLQRMYGDYCLNPKSFQIDHILGSQAKRKINGITTKVGEFAIMPLPVEIHDITSNNRFNRTLKPAKFREAFGHEVMVWKIMLNAMVADGYELPFNNELIGAVTLR